MAGAGEGGRPPQPLHPKEHMSKWGSIPQSRLSHPPQHQTTEKPPPPGAAPHPSPGCTFSGFSSPMAQGATRGRRPVSLSWTVAVTRVCWSILGPTVCAICFSEG